MKYIYMGLLSVLLLTGANGFAKDKDSTCSCTKECQTQCSKGEKNKDCVCKECECKDGTCSHEQCKRK